MTGRGISIALLITYCLGVESIPCEDSSLGIVGGDEVNITEVPYMARYYSEELYILSGFACGATIVHERYLLSLASCYYDFREDGSPTYVVVGTDKRDSDEEAYDVEEVFPHPKSTNGHDSTPVVMIFDYDIAVLKLATPMKLSERVKPIPLAEKGFVLPEGAMMDTMGFGSSSANMFEIKFYDRLHKASVPQIAPEKCKRSNTHVTERMICTGEDMKGACYADSGGPLVYNNKLVGVLTWFVGCGTNMDPDIYSYIPELRDFIDGIIQKDA